jgi:ankyrin repeat protein
MYASSHGHLQIVKLLLEKGSQVNAQDEEGDTALAYAAVRGAPKDVLNELIATGADVKHRNKRGKTAEALALENGHQENAELFREAGKKQ